MATTIHVLLVDDEANFVETLALRLGERGLNVTTATSGTEALGVCGTNQAIDVVVLDVAMPGLDGLATLERIKADRPLIEVTMLTGRTTVQTAVTALKQGAFDYLQKPFEIETLVAMILKAALRKHDRENRIRDIRSTPYLTDRQREKMLQDVLNDR